MFKKFAHVVNMSTSPEAILAREAGIEYAVIAMSTDYDCWKMNEEPVSWEEIKKVMDKNSENVKKVLVKTIEKLTNEEITGEDLEFIKSKIRTIPNFPKPGIMFRDITTLFQDPKAMRKTIEILHKRYKDKKIDYVAGIEARGFIVGGSLAEKLNCGFIPIRKKGKLPYEVERQEYDLEYGTDIIEIHKDALKPGQRILIVDDLIATGGTAKAACDLIRKLGGEIVECSFIIDLPELGGKQKLANYPVFTLIEFEGE
jgi:adenine phosphoribosyltransferase